MSGQILGLGFVVGTATLALWAVQRWPWHPASLRAVLVHVALAITALQLAFAAVHDDSSAWWRFAGLLMLVGPALVYTWLCGLWAALFLRAAR
jgi:hypothetical protein